MRDGGAVGIVAFLVCAVLATGVWADVGSLADSSGEVVGWGDNSCGQLDVPAGSYKAVATGDGYSLGLLTDGTLVGWGWNGSGRATVPSGTFRDVAAGAMHGLAIRTDDTLVAWGNNDCGQSTVPSGTFAAVSGGWWHSLGLRTDGTLAGWGSDSAGVSTVPTGTFSAVAAGALHSVGLRTDGTVATWGSNGVGQLNNIPTGTFSDVAAGNTHSLGIRTDGTLAAWGNSFSIQADHIPTGMFTDVAGGSMHSVALRTDGTLVGWGPTLHIDPDAEDPLDLTPPEGKFVAVVAGGYQALALRARTSYDDLLVDGSGAVTDVASWFNRDITVSGDATIRGTIRQIRYPTMDVGGQITLEPSGVVICDDFAMNWHGKFLGLAGSSLTNVVGDIGTDSSTDGFAHYGSLWISENSMLTLHDADMAVLGGRTTIDGGYLEISEATQGITVAPGGVLESTHSSTSLSPWKKLINHGTVQGLTVDNALVEGDGQFVHVYFTSGTFAPGLSPGTATLEYCSLVSETIEMELGGLTQGTEYDHFDILGTVTMLDSSLNVVLIDGFTPDSGDFFDLIDGTLLGTFDAVNLPTLTTGLYWDWSTLYTDGILRVLGSTPAAVPAPGAAILVLLGAGMIVGKGRRTRR